MLDQRPAQPTQPPAQNPGARPSHRPASRLHTARKRSNGHKLGPQVRELSKLARHSIRVPLQGECGACGSSASHTISASAGSLVERPQRCAGAGVPAMAAVPIEGFETLESGAEAWEQSQQVRVPECRSPTASLRYCNCDDRLTGNREALAGNHHATVAKPAGPLAQHPGAHEQNSGQ